MPKNSKTSIIPNKEKNFIYQTQSPKKTHCHKTINNHHYNTQPEIILNKPINHWTEDKDHHNWAYYTFATNQINLVTSEFQKTQDWHHWQLFQKNYQILKSLVNNSLNLSYHSAQEIKDLNDKVLQNYKQKGKAPQTGSQQ
jgi:hypothetical protein